MKGNLYILRMYDYYDGWINIKDNLSKQEADDLYNEYTENGTKNTKYEDYTYYSIFPSNTKMIYSSEKIDK